MRGRWLRRGAGRGRPRNPYQGMPALPGVPCIALHLDNGLIVDVLGNVYTRSQASQLLRAGMAVADDPALPALLKEQGE